LLAARSATLFSILLAAALIANVARAQPTQDEYPQLVERALHEYELGNYAEAKAFFQRAHQLSPSARTLRGLGMVSYELRRYVEAIGLFKQALASKDRPLTAEMQREVSQLLSQALSFVTWLDLSVSPQQARVRVDTREATRASDGRIMLDPGSHEIMVDAPGYPATTRVIRSDGADTLTLSIRLLEQNQQPATPQALQSTSKAASSRSAVGPYVLMGASAALAVAGGILLAVALDHRSAVEHPPQSMDGPRFPDYQSKADSVLPLSAAGIGSLCAGGVGVIAGVIWKLTGGDSGPTEKNPNTRLSVIGTTLTLVSHFP
jgi:tetratricopeptide (TPR) repeat protein